LPSRHASKIASAGYATYQIVDVFEIIVWAVI